MSYATAHASTKGGVGSRRSSQEPPVFDSDLARLIRLLRESTHPVRADWARAVGVGYLTAYRWERNGTIPDRGNVEGIVRVCETRVHNVRELLDRAIREQQLAANGTTRSSAPQPLPATDSDATLGPTLAQHPRWPAIARYLLVERRVPQRTVEQTARLPWVWDDFATVNEHKVFDLIRAVAPFQI